MLLLCSQVVRRAGRSLSVSITFLTWAAAQMFYANLRVVAVPIAFGLAFVRIGQGDVARARRRDAAADHGVRPRPAGRSPL